MEYILVKNASENNLKHITVSFPLNSFTCVTGCSGCGKSSLVFDTVYAESQRAFLESMSGNMYGQKLMNKPKVDFIENLRPALNVSQNYYNFNPRSTVGTVTDIAHYLRALYSLITSTEHKKIIAEFFFSSNNPQSCCPACKGLGEEYAISEDALIPDRDKKLKDGAILLFKGSKTSKEYKSLIAICDFYGIDPEKKVSELTKGELNNLLYRKNSVDFHLTFKNVKGRYRQKDISLKGAVVELREKLKDVDTPSTYISIAKYLKKQPCSCCNGTKLKTEVLRYKICKKNIAESEATCFSELKGWLKNVQSQYKNSVIANLVSQLVSQINTRVSLINELNIEYLSSSRTIPSLSNGEIQRVRIATQLTCPLKDLIYILDEPCKGLHYRNIKNIINATNKLIEKGNTVIAIEHNKQYMSASDKIIELGPVGGPGGGYLIAENKPKVNLNITLNLKKTRSCVDYFELKNINFRNIKNQNVKIPIGGITCVSGVSGSGKSTLVSVISDCFSAGRHIHCDYFDGNSKLKRVYVVDQKPIGKTPRSTVISYLEIYDEIRDLFASTKSAKKHGFGPANFSMNVPGGRCECCQGTGVQKIEMNFLPDSYIICPECKGKRFNSDVLEIKYKNKNISEILDASIGEIIELFNAQTSIYSKLNCMILIGLDYIKLGQLSMSLSGGEAQRIKLARALGSSASGKNLYILDEPTSGLSDIDIQKLTRVLLELQKNNQTLLIIEHNIEFISEISDYMIDFGIYGGNAGGIICAQGLPFDVINDRKSSWHGLFNVKPSKESS